MNLSVNTDCRKTRWQCNTSTFVRFFPPSARFDCMHTPGRIGRPSICLSSSSAEKNNADFDSFVSIFFPRRHLRVLKGFGGSTAAHAVQHKILLAAAQIRVVKWLIGEWTFSSAVSIFNSFHEAIENAKRFIRP
jgi:hypothetical protein